MNYIELQNALKEQLYKESDGMDSEMSNYNDGINDALKLLEELDYYDGFRLSSNDQASIEKWLKKINKKIIKEQKETMSKEDFKLLTSNGKHPYTGAIGGGLTYSFTPTSIGVVTKITHYYNNYTLDVTDYDCW